MILSKTKSTQSSNTIFSIEIVLVEKKPTLVIWSDHIGLVKFAKDYFQHLWSTAKH